MRFGCLRRAKDEETCISFSLYSRNITLLLVADKLIREEMSLELNTFTRHRVFNNCEFKRWDLEGGEVSL